MTYRINLNDPTSYQPNPGVDGPTAWEATWAEDPTFPWQPVGTPNPTAPNVGTGAKTVYGQTPAGAQLGPYRSGPLQTFGGHRALVFDSGHYFTSARSNADLFTLIPQPYCVFVIASASFGATSVMSTMGDVNGTGQSVQMGMDTHGNAFLLNSGSVGGMLMDDAPHAYLGQPRGGAVGTPVNGTEMWVDGVRFNTIATHPFGTGGFTSFSIGAFVPMLVHYYGIYLMTAAQLMADPKYHVLLSTARACRAIQTADATSLRVATISTATVNTILDGTNDPDGLKWRGSPQTLVEDDGTFTVAYQYGFSNGLNDGTNGHPANKALAVNCAVNTAGVATVSAPVTVHNNPAADTTFGWILKDNSTPPQVLCGMHERTQASDADVYPIAKRTAGVWADLGVIPPTGISANWSMVLDLTRNLPNGLLIGGYQNTAASPATSGVIVSDGVYNPGTSVWTRVPISSGTGATIPIESRFLAVPDGRILGIGRTANHNGSMYQYELDIGVDPTIAGNWRVTGTNITDQTDNAGTLVLRGDVVDVYYWDRATGDFRRRSANLDQIWADPQTWGPSYPVMIGHVDDTSGGYATVVRDPNHPRNIACVGDAKQAHEVFMCVENLNAF